MRAWLEEIRQALGPAPRELREDGQLRARPPEWMTAADDLRPVYRLQLRLLREGQVVWGHVVQANTQLFEPGAHDHPGQIVFSPDPYFDHRLDELAALASDLFDLKGRSAAGPPLEPELAEVGRLLAGERDRVLRARVPPVMTEGLEVHYGSVMFHRRFLPGGMLRESFLPVLIAPGLEPALPLPSARWGPGLLAAWEAAPNEEAATSRAP